MIKIISILMAVFALHVAGHFLMYRGRITSPMWIFHSDLVGFFVPAMIAFALYFFTLRTPLAKRPGLGMGAALGGAAGLTALSFFVGMTVALNVYGS